jgi:hydroxymethylbilane synthase
VVQSSAATTLLRIGTRGSPLALAQANMVRDQVAALHGIAPDRIEIKVISTTGDQIVDRPLADVGGKGLFTKEIEETLLGGTIDLAVHSAKDMATVLPRGLTIAAVLPREDARDAFISRVAKSFGELPPGALVGTASLRRQAQVKRLRRDLDVISFRGNVQTRLRKLEEGSVEATLLAYAGLKRLGLSEAATAILSIENFLPAVGQGIIAIETREVDQRTRDFIGGIDHPDTAIALQTERAFLAVLDGSCRTPIAGHATVAEDQVQFRGLIAKTDGSQSFQIARTGSVRDAAALGADAGGELKQRGGAKFFVPA